MAKKTTKHADSGHGHGHDAHKPTGHDAHHAPPKKKKKKK